MINEIMQRCPGCMRPLEGAAVCAACGTPVVFEQGAPFLPLRTMLLQGRIGIGRAVDQNGDGITYMAFDEQVKKPVYVREFFPEAIAVRAPDCLTQMIMQGCDIVWRDCAQNFLELWRKLQRIRGLSALLAVTDVFEENGTVYAIYEYIESMTLRDFLLRGKLGYISWERTRTLLMPVLSMLGHLHQQGILHRGISPNTLLFCADGKVRLAGFSIWQARTANGDLTAQLPDGYAAIEQYGIEDKQGPWTDIYAFAAVLFRCMIGSDPDSAVARRQNDRLMVPAQFAERIPAYVINALINAMQILPDDRTRTVEHLRAELSASPAAVAQSAAYFQAPMSPPKNETTRSIPQPEIKTVPPKPRSAGAVAAKTTLIIAGAGLAVMIIVMSILYRDSIKDFVGGVLGQRTTAATTTAEMVVVPDLRGEPYDEALRLQYENKLDFNTSEQYDQNSLAGQIIWQNLTAHQEVPAGTRIDIIISLGPENIAIPEVVGKPIAEVTAQLKELGFEVVTTDFPNDGNSTPNTVKSIQPEAGVLHPKGKQVFVVVWASADGTPLGETTTLTE